MSALTILRLRGWVLLVCALVAVFGFDNHKAAVFIISIGIAHIFAADVVAALREPRA